MTARPDDPALVRDRLVTSEALAAPLHVPCRTSAGVNFVGFLEVESGLGEFARRLARAVGATGVPMAVIPYRGTHGRRQHPLEFAVGESAPYDVNLVSLSADDLVRFGAAVGPEFFANRYSVGVWFWETDMFRPEARAATRFLDELWVASNYVRDAISTQVDIPVHVVPMPVERPPGPFRTRTELDLPDTFTFLYVFDYWSGERKNPDAVVEAFVSAFRPGEGPVLVLKSIHGRDWKPHQFESVAAIAAGRRDVIFRDGYVGADERDSYVAACDCYVSLHRSEGLGLTMVEAMACAKPVIATGYSGNLEFMSERTSLLVPYRLVDVPDTWRGYALDAKWAEPDVATAAALMRRVWERPTEAHAMGVAGRDAILERFSPGRTASVITDRLADARARRAVTARAAPYDSRPPILDATRLLADNGIGESLARPRPRPRRRPRAWPVSFMRQVARRVLWPHLEDERRFDSVVLDALTVLHRSVEQLEQRVLQLEAPDQPETHAGSSSSPCSDGMSAEHVSSDP